MIGLVNLPFEFDVMAMWVCFIIKVVQILGQHHWRSCKRMPQTKRCKPLWAKLLSLIELEWLIAPKIRIFTYEQLQYKILHLGNFACYIPLILYLVPVSYSLLFHCMNVSVAEFLLRMSEYRMTRSSNANNQHGWIQLKQISQFISLYICW